VRVLLLLAFAVALMGQRDPILVPEVSQHEVQVRQGFTGTELLLFGAVLDPQGRAAGSDYDIVVVLKGPSEPVRLREKERFAGVWINAASSDFRSVPSYFAVASSRPIGEIVDEKTAAIYEFGTDYIQLSPSGVIDPDEQARFKAGLVDLKTRQELYKQDFGGVHGDLRRARRARDRIGAGGSGGQEGGVRKAGGGILAGVVADLRPAGSGVVGRHGLGRGAAVRADLSDLRGLALTTY